MFAKKLGRYSAAALLAAYLSTTAGHAQSMRADLTHPSSQTNTISATNVDLRALRDQMKSFEGLLNANVQQLFQGPFTLLQDAKGIYLPGYGVAFHLEANLYPLRVLSPFDQRPYSPEELRKAKEDKIKRISELKARLSELLLEHGSEVNAMAPEQNLAIVVHLFNLPSEARDLPTQLVISTTRTTLLEYQTRRLTAAEFQKTGSFLEF